MRVAITGSTGFVGAALVRHFAAAGHEVLAYGRPRQPPPHLLRHARYVSADITQPLAPIPAEVCIHAAALSSDTAPAADLHAANVQGTRHVLAAAAGCEHFVQISSSSVYRPSPLPLREEDAPAGGHGLSPYGASKLQAEQVVRAGIRPGQRVTILRPRGIYGVGDRVLLPRLLGLVQGGRIIGIGDLRVLTSLTHVSNLAPAIERVLQQPAGPGGAVYNIADAEPYLLREAVMLVTGLLTRRHLTLLPLPVRLILPLALLLSTVGSKSQLTPFAVSSMTRPQVLDLGRAESELGFRPPLRLEQGLEEMAAWVERFGGWQKYLREAEKAPWVWV